MANDPMTVDSISASLTLREGVSLRYLTVSGPADYDKTAGTGSLFDLSAYYDEIYYLVFGGCTAVADNAILPRYVNDDLTATDTGFVTFHWSADGTDGEPFVEVETRKIYLVTNGR